MARTHWRENGQGWEFLGAFPDNYKENPRSGQVFGRVLVIPGTAQEVIDRLGDRTQLVGLPASIRKHLVGDKEFDVPFEQIEGYLK